MKSETPLPLDLVSGSARFTAQAANGLKLHPDQTRLVPFTRPQNGSSRGETCPPPGTFDLLGFTHHWGRSHKGNWVVQRQTASNRFSRVVRTITQWCRCNRHQSITEQHESLSQKLRGHDAYFGITGNYRKLAKLRQVVVRVWKKWLGRRGSGPLNWEGFGRLLERFPLPAARVVHSVFA